MRRLFLALFAAGTVAIPPAQAQPLPLAEEVDAVALKAHCRQLLQALAELKVPLPDEAARDLTALLDDPRLDADTFSVRVQKLLDARCLIGVTINPESRVKAARGPLPANLAVDSPVWMLIKVHNEAGVTHPLVVGGPQLRTSGEAGPDQWLSAAVVAAKPLGKNLTGQKVEYVVMRLTAHQKGKREATLRFDVGQGTQDLGFRAEVPILFTVR